MTTKDDLEAHISDPLEFCRLLAQKIDALGAEVTPASALADIPSPTALTAVPGSFADLAAVRTYLNTLVPIISTRLGDIETKVNATLAKLRSAGVLLP